MENITLNDILINPELSKQSVWQSSLESCNKEEKKFLAKKQEDYRKHNFNKHKEI